MNRKLQNINHFNELQEVLIKNKLKREDMCIVGSAVLSLKGIRNNNDIDIVILPGIREKHCNTKKAVNLSDNIEVVGQGWAERIGIKDYQIIQEQKFYQDIDGWKIIKLEVLFLLCLHRNRDKDMRDKYLIEKEIMLTNNNWDWQLFKELEKKITINTKNSKQLPRFSRIMKLFFKAIKNPILVKERITQKTKKHISQIRNNYKIKPQLIIKINTYTLLGNQFINGEFSRYDILLRYLAIKSIVERKEEYKDYYIQMQQKRVNRESYHKLRELVISIQENGFLSRYAITINQNGKLLDGAHRLAAALYFKVDEVPVSIQVYNKNIYYRRKWFEENGFKDNLLKELDEAKRHLFYENGIWFPVLLWATVEPWWDEIEIEINKKFAVKDKSVLYLGDKFSKFLKEIYKIDDIACWKIKYKLHSLEDYKPKVRIFWIEIPDPVFRRKNNMMTYISTEVELLKKEIRKKYHVYVKNYVYDIICHIGDNQEHNNKIMKIIKKFKL